jgi:hypothetical protein
VDFDKVDQYIRLHSSAALLVTIAVVPATWAVASTLHSERFATLEERVKDSQDKITELDGQLKKLNDEVVVLREASKRRLELQGGRVDFSDLYTPSPNVIVAKVGQ